MKPVPFDYYAPTSLKEALEVLAQLGYNGKVLAGGQSLVPAMNFRVAQPGALVDLNNIPELFYIRPTPAGGVMIGAMTRAATVEKNPLIVESYPIIPEAMFHVAHPQVRNRGTFGGALAHADPAGQMPGVVIALNARCHLLKKGGERWVGADDFFIGPFASVLEPDELLIEVEIPPVPARSGMSYHQVARQHGAQAQAGVNVVVTLDEKNRCKQAMIVFISVGERPLVARQAAQMLAGKELTPDLIRTAAEYAASKEIDPGTDIHATEEYRRSVSAVIARRALSAAYEQALKKGG
jgi:aerobic carbon-monoxide dehydrogenase medium subunit